MPTITVNLRDRCDRAPISSQERETLRAAAKNVLGTAQQKGLDCDNAIEEELAAENHFELGCWLYYYSAMVYLEDGLHHRIDCLRRIFEAGISLPGYQFFTVFNFGERQFDTIFEMGDADAVVAEMRRLAASNPDGKLAACVKVHNW